MLTPLAVDPSHPFPYISGFSLNLAVVVRNPDTGGRALRPGQGAAACCRGWCKSSRGPCSVPLEDVIATHFGQLFPGMEATQNDTFRVTRNEDLEVERYADAENLLAALEKELLRRRLVRRSGSRWRS